MARFLFQAKDAAGKPVADWIEAESLAEARILLDKGGYSQIEFHTSDGHAESERLNTLQSGNRLHRSLLPHWSAFEELASRKRRGLRAKLWWALGKHMVFLGVLLEFNISSLIRHKALTPLAEFGFACTGIYLIWAALKCGPMVCYDRMLDALIWRDWNRMRRYIRIARLIRQVLGKGIPESEMITREAYALANEGHLAEALTRLETAKPLMPAKSLHLYLVRLSTLYRMAGDNKKHVQFALEAFEQSPKTGQAWTDLALMWVREEKNILEAKNALAKVQDFELDIMTTGAFLSVAGMISNAERRYEDAVEELQSGVGALSTHGNPLAQSLVAEAKAHLCIAYAHLGKQIEARKLWKEVGPLVRAQNGRTGSGFVVCSRSVLCRTPLHADHRICRTAGRGQAL